VAINKNTGEVEAAGKEAKEMLGQSPHVRVAIGHGRSRYQNRRLPDGPRYNKDDDAVRTPSAGAQP
jgi:hypothetical protein